MRFVEMNPTNLRVVIHYLKKSGDGLEFILFPMIHPGTQEFYDEIGRRLADCDVILAEGVNSKKLGFLMLLYRVAAKSKRINLLVQDKALSVSRFKDKVIKSDLDGHLFDERWSNLSLSLRAEFLIMMPIAILYLFFFGNREKLAKYMLGKGSASTNEGRDEEMERFARLMGGDRNQALSQHIKGLYESRKREQIKVGIPYGAKHMSRVEKYLERRLGYRVAKREWVTVFDF